MPLLLTQEDLRRLLEDPSAMDSAFAVIEAAFLEHARGEAPQHALVQLPLAEPRAVVRVVSAASPTNGATVRMNAVLPGSSPHPDSHVNLLFDAKTGQLLAVMAGDDLNVFRTAVPAGVACRHLAPLQVKTLALLGSGRQARGQVAAIVYALPTLEEVHVFSPTLEHREAFAREVQARFGVAAHAVNSPRLAVDGADVIGVASNARAPVLEADWVRPGALVVSIGAGQLPPALVAGARVFVSAREELLGPAARREPYTSMAANGAWGPDRIAGDFAELLHGRIPGRPRDGETVLCEMPGMSAWDGAIHSWAYRWAAANGVGTKFHLSSR